MENLTTAYEFTLLDREEGEASSVTPPAPRTPRGQPVYRVESVLETQDAYTAVYEPASR